MVSLDTISFNIVSDIDTVSLDTVSNTLQSNTWKFLIFPIIALVGDSAVQSRNRRWTASSPISGEAGGHMSRSSPIVTVDSVRQAIEELKANGVGPTLRGIRTCLGGGSLSSIQAKRNEIVDGLPEIPPNIEAKLGPYINAGAELVQVTMKEAAALQMERFGNLQQDIETISEDLTKSEAENAELKAKVESLEAESIKRDVTIKLGLETNESLKMDLLRVNAELTQKTIREEDYKEAKAEAAEARERAAKLEGRLEEIERAYAKYEAERSTKESIVRKNKA
jgi:hypothetical protein